jgi:DNA repair protein RadD
MKGSRERDDIMLAYRNKELDSLVVNGIGTTGLDIQWIDHIIGLRPTMSVGLHVQMIGRGTRPFEFNGWRKTDCLVSDHAGNTKRLGPIDDPYIPKMKGKNPGEAPVKICDACDCYNHASARVCMFCGEIFDIKFSVKTKAFNDELIRSDLPIMEWFNVSHVYYTQHEKKRPMPTDKPTIKAVYACGIRSFTEYVTIESAVPFLRKKFSNWWRQRCQDQSIELPNTALEALQHIDKLVPPRRIEVWVNKEFPSIQSHEY